VADTKIDDIVKSKLPVLCLDTCIILDLLRFPEDCASGVRMHTAARRILRAVKGQELVILIADQVSLELDNCLDQTEQKSIKDIEELRSAVNDLEAATAVYERQRTSNLDHLDQYVLQARKVIDGYRSLAIPAMSSEHVLRKAYTRMTQARTPAHKGKDAINDCVIIETYLEIAHLVRARGHQKSFVFATSDVNDYGQKPNPDLRVEFNAVKVEFAPKLSAARHHLGISA